MKAIYKFYWDCGRQGYVESLFVAEKAEVQKVIGTKIYFGEILGKHSEIYGELNEEDLTILSEDQEFIKKLESIMGKGTISGHNPLQYPQEE